MDTRKASPDEDCLILKSQEDHFNDVKSKRIAPGKLQESFVAFANADGGDLWIGIEDAEEPGERIIGLAKKEEANQILYTLLEETKPAVENVDIEFVDFGVRGLVLHISIPKSPKVHYCANGDCYIRINAQKVKIKGERIVELGYAKGSLVYEKQPVEIAEIEDVLADGLVTDYMKRIGSKLQPELFLRKQRLLSKRNDEVKPNVACVLLFDRDPQATMETRCAIKVYRLLTTEEGYKREQLKGDPITINGPIESQIIQAIEKINELIKGSSVMVDGKMEKFNYPTKAIHEVLVNAVIHRDYSLNDDIHVRVYDNRIEVISPGKLPGYITTKNIYDERFSRNPNIVRLLHNLPNPVNHDIGEGLDTAKNEMKRAGLVEPEIFEKDNSVKIVLKHKKIASLEDIILDYLSQSGNSTITNKIVRQISGEDDVNKIKSAFQKLRRLDKIELVDPNAAAFDYSYRLKSESAG